MPLTAMSLHRGSLSCILLAAALCVAPRAAEAQLELDWRGYVESDLRFALEDDVPFERSESTLYGRIGAKMGAHLAGAADLRLAFVERPSPLKFAGLTDRQALDAFRWESDAMYVELRDLGPDGLDLRIGRQRIAWGSADRFNPTSNLNALDVEDPLAFGETIANEMITVRYRPYVWFGDEDEPWFQEFSLEAVFVPVFKPAQLPESGGLAITDVDEAARLATTAELKELAGLQREFFNNGAVLSYDVDIDLPDRNAVNSMVGVRMGWNLLGVDMSVSWFRGFDDFPRAEKAFVTGDANDVRSNIHLTYPRVQVLGADMATSLDWLDGVGLWAEVGVTFHDDLFVVIDGRGFFGYEGIAALNTPPVKEHEAGQFVKAVVGMDYTPAPWMYVNAQYLHGFIDEFGTESLDDYIVGGMDFKLLRDKLTIRLFSIVNITDSSFVLFPQLIIKPFSAGEISVGGFLFSGLFDLPSDTKFGSPIVGASTVFAKARFSF